MEEPRQLHDPLCGLCAALRCAACSRKCAAAWLQAALRAATGGIGICRSSVTAGFWLPVALGKAHPDGLSVCAPPRRAAWCGARGRAVLGAAGWAQRLSPLGCAAWSAAEALSYGHSGEVGQSWFHSPVPLFSMFASLWPAVSALGRQKAPLTLGVDLFTYFSAVFLLCFNPLGGVPCFHALLSNLKGGVSRSAPLLLLPVWALGPLYGSKTVGGGSGGTAVLCRQRTARGGVTAWPCHVLAELLSWRAAACHAMSLGVPWRLSLALALIVSIFAFV